MVDWSEIKKPFPIFLKEVLEKFSKVDVSILENAVVDLFVRDMGATSEVKKSPPGGCIEANRQHMAYEAEPGTNIVINTKHNSEAFGTLAMLYVMKRNSKIWMTEQCSLAKTPLGSILFSEEMEVYKLPPHPPGISRVDSLILSMDMVSSTAHSAEEGIINDGKPGDAYERILAAASTVTDKTIYMDPTYTLIHTVLSIGDVHALAPEALGTWSIFDVQSTALAAFKYRNPPLAFVMHSPLVIEGAIGESPACIAKRKCSEISDKYEKLLNSGIEFEKEIRMKIGLRYVEELAPHKQVFSSPLCFIRKKKETHGKFANVVFYFQRSSNYTRNCTEWKTQLAGPEFFCSGLGKFPFFFNLCLSSKIIISFLYS